MNKTEKIRAERWIFRLQILQEQMGKMTKKIDRTIYCRSDEYIKSGKGQQELEEFTSLKEALWGVQHALEALTSIDMTETRT